MSSTSQRVRQIVADDLNLDQDSIDDNADFVNDYRATKRDMDQICEDLEQEFTINIPQEDERYISSVHSTVGYIDDHHGMGH
ncbi:hypothetical protein EYZ11_009052 [Aspergillus tanneri]|uniref:Carrier domain-containing protein n=1 Tax=Aspergillus tanneri TaxID=1220188 RepID=A0A4S3J9C8_9EURO|nr:uncharacterized protein ATNIH1004_009677 [Aspergillus tanneri]KAA8642916.1 hypothetical protein ATNIH1004_009677 [Aspergillus tanneri]THC91495.1 hypothetical protein EYZ11_009052 [Aspergillus tanneri]